MAQKPNITKNKSFAFAIRIVRREQYLRKVKRETVLSRQLLRSGTSIGANIREGYNAESDADFIHKLGIAQKECDETCYWLELLNATEYLDEKAFASIYADADTLLKISKSIILTKSKTVIELTTPQSQLSHSSYIIYPISLTHGKEKDKPR